MNEPIQESIYAKEFLKNPFDSLNCLFLKYDLATAWLFDEDTNTIYVQSNQYTLTEFIREFKKMYNYVFEQTGPELVLISNSKLSLQFSNCKKDIYNIKIHIEQ